MKDKTELAVLETALARDADPGTILATFRLDLPLSNGQIYFCVTRDARYYQPVAHLQPKTAGWTYRDPVQVRGSLQLPYAIHRYIRRTLKRIGIPHIRGVDSDDNTWLNEDPSGYLS